MPPPAFKTDQQTMRGKNYTKEEVEYLCACWKVKTHKEIAETLGRPLGSVHMKMFTLGLTGKGQPSKVKLSDQQRAWLRRNYPHVRTSILATSLGCSWRTVVRLAREMGLEKTPEFMAECQAYTAKRAKESNLEHGTYPPKGVVNENLKKGEPYRFKPGHEPAKRKPMQEPVPNLGERVSSADLDYSELAKALDKGKEPTKGEPKAVKKVAEATGQQPVSRQIVRDINAYANSNSFSY